MDFIFSTTASGLKMPVRAEGTPYRTYRTGDPVTMDFAPKRLNFEYDRSGKLIRVSCG